MIFKFNRHILFALIICTNFAIPSSFANTYTSTNTTNNKTLQGGVRKTTHHAQVSHRAQVSRSQLTWGQRHPKMKAAAVGGGLGAAAGGAVGLLSGRGVMRGALIGAGTGAGIGVARKTQIAARHPIMSDTLTGTAAGLGLGLASGRRHKAGEGALIGGAAGLGVGLWKHRNSL